MVHCDLKECGQVFQKYEPKNIFYANKSDLHYRTTLPEQIYVLIQKLKSTCEL